MDIPIEHLLPKIDKKRKKLEIRANWGYIIENLDTEDFETLETNNAIQSLPVRVTGETLSFLSYSPRALALSICLFCIFFNPCKLNYSV